MRAVLIGLLLLGLGCEAQDTPEEPPVTAEPEGGEPGEPEPGEPEPGEPEPGEPEPGEPEPGEPEPGEPEPGEPEPGEPEPGPMNACDQAHDFDEPTETGHRIERGSLSDVLNGSAVCSASSAWNGVDLVAQYTAERNGPHRFIASGAGVGHFYRMDAPCVRPTDCAQLPHHHDMNFFRDRELTLDLEVGEHVLLVADAAHEGFAQSALAIEVVTPADDRESCENRRCATGLVCGNGRCNAQAAPAIRSAQAWLNGSQIHVDIEVADLNADLAELTVRVGDDVIGGAVRGLWGESQYRLQAQLTHESRRPPTEIVVEVVDQTETRVEQIVELQPLPMRAEGEACDAARIADACLGGTACLNETCQAISAPRIWDATLHGADNFLVVEARVGDDDGDVQHLEARVGDVWTRLNIEFWEHGRSLRVIASGWVEALPDDAIEVVVVDAEGLRSAPLELAIQPARQVGEASVCDQREIAIACTDALACERGETVDTDWRCIEPVRVCPADWPSADLALGAVVDVEFGRDDAPLVWGSCGQNITPARIFNFTAQEAGNHRFTVGHDGDGTGRIWVRRFCNAPRAGELACNTHTNYHGGVSAADAVLEAGEQVTVFVAPHFAGDPQRLSVERTDEPFWE